MLFRYLREAIAGAQAMKFIGLNLTVPHKLLAVDIVDALDVSARTWGAVNTVRFEAKDASGAWQPLAKLNPEEIGELRSHGFNTDADAITRSLREDLGFEPRGASVLQLGAGGAGRTAALKLASDGVGALYLVNRTQSKAEEVAAAFARHGVRYLFIGKSGAIGRKIAATLTSTGSTSVVLDSVDALHGDLGIISDGDVILALSYSGESEELLNLLPAIKRFSVKIISLTGGVKSSLAKHSDVVLNVRVPKEACPFNLAPTASTTATLVMGDALAMAVLQARGFKQSDYAKYHPSGAIGRAMLLRVGEIMRSGERNAVAVETLTVKEALFVMTKAKSGSLAVVNGRGKLAGIFTDGDFRRRMSADGDLLSRLLKSVMTPNPITVRDTALAAEALKIFNERNIDDLIVVNAKHEPVGLVDSQDLPKLKMM